jgi:hypothetical protein
MRRRRPIPGRVAQRCIADPDFSVRRFAAQIGDRGLDLLRRKATQELGKRGDFRQPPRGARNALRSRYEFP